jgi:hypothetical protein
VSASGDPHPITCVPPNGPHFFCEQNLLSYSNPDIYVLEEGISAHLDDNTRLSCMIGDSVLISSHARLERGLVICSPGKTKLFPSFAIVGQRENFDLHRCSRKKYELEKEAGLSRKEDIRRTNSMVRTEGKTAAAVQVQEAIQFRSFHTRFLLSEEQTRRRNRSR